MFLTENALTEGEWQKLLGDARPFCAYLLQGLAKRGIAGNPEVLKQLERTRYSDFTLALYHAGCCIWDEETALEKVSTCIRQYESRRLQALSGNDSFLEMLCEAVSTGCIETGKPNTIGHIQEALAGQAYGRSIGSQTSTGFGQKLAKYSTEPGKQPTTTESVSNVVSPAGS